MTPTKTNLEELLSTTIGAVDALVEDCASFAEAAVNGLDRVLRRAAKTNTTVNVWLPSFITLGTVDTVLSSTRVAGAVRGLGVLGAAGGIGLMVSSTLDLVRATTAEEVLDATGDLTWGVQGLSYLASSRAVTSLTAGLGFVGAVVQMSAGMLRIARGIRTQDTSMVKLGSLDVGGGILWAALDVAAWGNPIVLGSYVVLMVGREAYANRGVVLKNWRRSPPLLLPPSSLTNAVAR